MFKVLRQFFYSLLVVVFLVNIISCDDAEMDNIEGIGVYALYNDTDRKLYTKIDGDSIFMDTFALQFIKVYNQDNGIAHPIVGLPGFINFYYQDSTKVDTLAMTIETKDMDWSSKDYDTLVFGHIQYTDTLEQSWLK